MFPTRRPSLFSHPWRRTASAVRRPAGHASAVVVGVIGICVSVCLLQVIDAAVWGEAISALRPTLVRAVPLGEAAAASGSATACVAIAATDDEACAQPAGPFDVPAATAQAVEL